LLAARFAGAVPPIQCQPAEKARVRVEVSHFNRTKRLRPLPIAQLPGVAQIDHLVAPVPSTPDAEGHHHTMLPTPPDQERQIKRVRVEADHLVDPPHLTACHLPELPDGGGLVFVTDVMRNSAFRLPR
jgi:hypothetical protein